MTKIKLFRGLALLMVLGSLAMLNFGVRKTITLSLDGERHELTTYAFTVGQALRIANVSVGPADVVIPGLDHWLGDGDWVQVTRAAQVFIWAEGEAQYTLTTNRHPANLLAQAGIPLYPGELILVNGMLVEPEGQLSHAPAFSIQALGAVSVTLKVGNRTFTLVSAAPTLGQALWEAGVILGAADRLTPGMETPLEEGMAVTLRRARDVTIQARDQILLTRSAAPTVGEVLAEVGVPLQGLDYSIPPEAAPLPADGQIRVVRVVEEIILEQEPLPFETLFQPLDDLEIDNLRLVQAGEFGVQASRVRVRYEDGVEVSRVVEDAWVAREPSARIEGYGAQIVVRTMSTPEGVIEYWRAIDAYATSYSPARSGTPEDSPWYGLTYSGQPLRKGLIAVLRSWYAWMGLSSIYVPGYGLGQIADIGGGIAGRHWIDLGYSDDDYEQWNNWTTLYLLTPVPPADQILWILP